MLDKKIGFIGSGNMGRAMIGGIISSGLVPASHLIASAKPRSHWIHFLSSMVSAPP